MKGYWVQPTRERHEMRLFDPTLDDMIPGDHPVRQLDALLDRLDWSPWEARYPAKRGRPPFHPRVVASAILYGLLTGERSSRELERACYVRLDFLWLLRGLAPDHCVFAAFRRNFGEELKDLNRQITRKALELSLDKMLELALDGTHLRASASKDSCKSAAALESLLTELDQRMEEALAESAARDEATGAALEELAKAREAATEEEQLEGEKPVENQAKSDDHEDDDQGSQGDEKAQEALDQPGEPREPAEGDEGSCPVGDGEKDLAKLEGRREKLLRAAQAARERNAARESRGRGSGAKVPVTDPEACVLPNKDGGYAPNYTPTVAVEKNTGCILHEDVVPGDAEAGCVVPAVDEVRELVGRNPEAVLFDGNFVSGQNLEALEEREVTCYAPTASLPPELSPAWRENPAEPLPEELWAGLPMRGRQLSRKAFLYDSDLDCYWCPLGKPLTFVKNRKCQGNGPAAGESLYRCGECEGCPLAGRCLSRKASGRSILRRDDEGLREELGRRMFTEEGQELYRERSWIAETPFAFIKGVLGIRGFLYRGLKLVRVEWRWICTAINLKKLMNLLSTLLEGGPAGGRFLEKSGCGVLVA